MARSARSLLALLAFISACSTGPHVDVLCTTALNDHADYCRFAARTALQQLERAHPVAIVVVDTLKCFSHCDPELYRDAALALVRFDDAAPSVSLELRHLSQKQPQISLSAEAYDPDSYIDNAVQSHYALRTTVAYP